LFAGHYDYVIESFRKAEEIDPRIPDFYFSTLGAAYHFKGQNELALAKLKRVVKPDVTNLQFRASAFVELGRQEEAREAVAEMLRANPSLTVALLRKTLPLRDTGDLERHLAGIRRAGLPEG
jgi:tetratricopeptide (TPR) repeat protein